MRKLKDMENNKPSRQELLAKAKVIREQKREIGRLNYGRRLTIDQNVYRNIVVNRRDHSEFNRTIIGFNDLIRSEKVKNSLRVRKGVAIDIDRLKGAKYLNEHPSTGLMIMLLNGEIFKCPHESCTCGKVPLHGEQILETIENWVECHIFGRTLMKLTSIFKSGNVYAVNLVTISIY